MSVADIQSLALGALQGLASSTVFVLVLFIGFCVVVGFTKLKKTAGSTRTMVIKSLDETISHQPICLSAAVGTARSGRPAAFARTPRGGRS